MTYEQALAQLHDWTKTDSLLKHCRAVEIVMRAAADKYGGADADADRWAVAGLLHDADYEQWPDEHPRRIVDWLREQGEEAVADAVAFHRTDWRLEPKGIMDKALVACDELTGFVVACSLVRPEGVSTLKPKSVVKKLKDKGFAAKVDRQVIQQGIELLDVDRGEHIQFVIDSLKPHAEELGIAGSAV